MDAKQEEMQYESIKLKKDIEKKTQFSQKLRINYKSQWRIYFNETLTRGAEESQTTNQEN